MLLPPERRSSRRKGSTPRDRGWLYGWRKWTIAASALVMAFVLALLGKLTADFATVASITVGAFAAGNAIEHYRGGADEGTPDNPLPRD